MNNSLTKNLGLGNFVEPISPAWLLLIAVLIPAGCNQQQEPSRQAGDALLTANIQVSPESLQSPADSQNASAPSPARTYDIPRFAANSPFDKDYESPLPKEGKRLWASSRLWEKSPDFIVEKWLTGKPDINSKYLLIEFWATWCRQCKRATPKLNDFHRRFGEKLVVIGISDEQEQLVRKLEEPKMDFYIAIDTQARMKKQLGVLGIPHVIIVEPNGYVVWEGFPLLKDYELTEEVIEKILEVGNKKTNR